MKTKSSLFLFFFWIAASFVLAADLSADRKIYDENHDRIFENLQFRMQRVHAGERIPVLIQYREDVPVAGTLAVRLSSILRTQDLKYSYRNIPAVAASLTSAQIRETLTDPMVDHVELDGVMHEAMATASPAFGVTQVRQQFGFTGDGDGKPDTYTNKDVAIAIIDTGVDASHPDLRGKILYFKDFINGKTAPYDDEGHGTHVAGVAAGAGKANKAFTGVAPGAALVIFKALDSTGSGDVADGIAAIDEAITRKDQFHIRVLNLSLAVSGSSDGKDTFSQACNQAVAHGIVTVVAAGNDGPGSRTIGTPAASASAITVGAGADTGEKGFYLVDFSSRGPTADGRIKPDLWAPGLRLRSPQKGGGYSDISGTSFSAPFVSGVAALMLDAKPTLTPAAVKTILLATALRWAPGGKNNDFGAGRLQAYQAVTRAAGITQNLHPPVPPPLKFFRSTISSGQTQTFQIKVLSTQAPVAITLVMLNFPAANIQMAVTSSAGVQVARSAHNERQETVAFQPTSPGVYTLTLNDLAGGATYLIDISGDVQ